MSRFSEWTAGRWPEIVSALVGSEATNTRKHQPCAVIPGSTDCYRFADRGDSGNYFCRCSDGSKGGFDLIQCRLGVDFMGAVKLIEGVIGPCPRDDNDEPKRENYGEILLREGVRSGRSKYLESRGLIVPPGLLFHRGADYRDADGQITGKYPAMLAPIMREGEVLSVHVTYLQDGKKAPVDTVRKILPGKRVAGGAVELWPAATKMGVAEGVETAIAASMLFDIPVWAALNTSLLKAFEPPEVCEELVIFADHDENFAGHAAAYALAHAQSARVLIDVCMPGAPGEDWNDVLLNKQAKERKLGEV
jgi:putative DNA primase/helicase